MIGRGKTWQVGLLAAAAVTGGTAVVTAAVPTFEVEAILRAPSGQAWKGQTITTPQEVPGTAEFLDGARVLRLALVISEGAEDGCHPVFILLEPVVAGVSRGKPSTVNVVACEGKTIDIDGSKLGGPSLQMTLNRLRR